ncbi:E3 ubiquitin-protein ligase UBR2-like [Sinocyclocheilus rhinocerous]|uniref:E3 ubiquitin-protein ligase UBR2-like n=1 Tax=Sinocyclocheilus rhinocerous TaxID=307959 RepID=UPI0007B9F247|nr:PREDICTED: E3 ubiquitin-protein ligase UBR2-like [Sinocyclocheilus rhinocerous]
MQQAAIILQIEESMPCLRRCYDDEYIHQHRAPLGEFYDDDVTSNPGQDAEMKKLTEQIKDTLDKYLNIQKETLSPQLAYAGAREDTTRRSAALPEKEEHLKTLHRLEKDQQKHSQDLSELKADKWLQVSNLPKEVYQHLACYVPKIYCLGPNLNPQNEDLLAPLLLQSPLEWYLCGEEPSVGLAKLEQNNQPSQLCGHVFKVGEPTYSCRECAADPTCVLCMQCFLGSVHKEHRYRMTTSGGGGFCDCGDTEAWKKGPYCQKHEPNISDSSQKDPLANLSDEMIARTYNVFSIILKYAVDMLTWEKEDELPEGLEPPARGDTYYCMLFNDEVHTYEQVIYTLQKAVNCTQKEAVSFATTVDRDGRKSVRFGDFQFCEQAKSVIVRNTSRQTKPLRVQVMHSSVVAHQCFALKALTWLGQIIRYSDALRRILCQVGLQRGPEGENSSLVDTLMLCDSKMWKGARNVYHQLFMSSLLMDTKYKKLFAIQFAKNYERLQNDYVKDDHDREFSVTDLSVQMFTVPSLARMLITEENLMTTIIRTFMDHLRHRDLQGHFQFERYTAQQAFKFRRVQSLIGDLKYVLISRPTEWTDQLREKYLESFDAFLELLKCMQGMDPVVRQVGQHIEMEPEWEAAFTLQMKLTHIISMMQEWCANAGASMMDPNHFLMIMLSRFELYHIFSSADCRKRCSRENANKDVVQQNNTLIEEMLHLVIMIVGERYTAGVGQVECSDEIRREIVHQLCIRSMAHSELVKALPENENKETGMERVIDSVASFKKPGVTGRGLYKLRPECAKMFNLYFHHYSRADQSKAEEAQRKIKRQNGEDSAPGEAPANTPSILALLETLQNAPHLEVHKDMIRWILKTVANIKTMRECTASAPPSDSSGHSQEETVRDKDKAERKRKAEMARLRREKIMAQMSEMQRHFINENKELFQQSLEELDPSTSSTLEHSPSSCDCTLVCVGPRRWRAGGSERRQVVTCILCQEEQEIRTDGKAMVLAAFVQRSTVMSKNRKRPPHNPDKYDPLFMHPDLSFGTHTGSCGHIMHSHCWQRYFEAVQAKEQRRQQRLRVHTSYNVENGEFLCPLCECLSNTVIPLLPLTKISCSSEQPDLSQWLNITSLQMKALLSAHRKAKAADADGVDDMDGVNDCPPPDGFKLDYTPKNPYSSTIKEMLTTFGTASYKVGLKVHPNEQDPRVPIMCWGSCAYTIQSIERLLVDEEKPLFGSLPCRQDDCLSSLTRFGSACWTVSSHATVQNHFIRLLAALVPDPRVENTPCILDIDMFHLLVSLVLSHPAVFSLDSSGLSADTAQLHFLHLVTVAHIVQILLTSVAEEVRMEQESGGAEREEEEKVCMFYNTLRMHLGSGLREVNSGWHLWRCVKAGILPYLRAAAMFFHYLNGAPAPPELHTLGVGEWEALCGYLCLPSNLLQLFYNNRELMEPLLHGWCSHPGVLQGLQSSVAVIRFPRDSNYLIELPGDYSALINQASSFTCPKSEGDKSRAPTLCLVCGAMLCSQSYCCQTELEGEDVGACTAHTFACGAGVGIFLRVRESQVLFLAGKTKGCFYAPPYLDDYGETDQGLRRGNPLHLCQERYRKIQKLWRQHSITEEIGHAQEANQTLVGIDWQHL